MCGKYDRTLTTIEIRKKKKKKKNKMYISFANYCAVNSIGGCGVSIELTRIRIWLSLNKYFLFNGFVFSFLVCRKGVTSIRSRAIGIFVCVCVIFVVFGSFLL